MATNNEIAAFENFKFNIGDMVQFRAPAAVKKDYQITASFNAATANWTTLPTEVNTEDSYIKGVVVSRSLMQGNSGGIARTYFVRSPSFANETTFESELEHVPVK